MTCNKCGGWIVNVDPPTYSHPACRCLTPADLAEMFSSKEFTAHLKRCRKSPAPADELIDTKWHDWPMCPHCGKGVYFTQPSSVMHCDNCPEAFTVEARTLQQYATKKIGPE